jgi:uncharacterized membrane protein
MDGEVLTAGITLVARTLEVIGVAVIAFAFVSGMARGLLQIARGKVNVYDRMKLYLGRALLLGLEFLVAADIVRTVTIEATLKSLLSLGLLVVVRIILGWSITLELSGCWPWQEAARK